MTLLPVKLPLQIKTELEVKDDLETKFTQVKVKTEPMDVDDEVKPKVIAPEDKSKSFSSKPAVRAVTCTDLFADPSKSGNKHTG